jgi:hypothetical protein
MLDALAVEQFDSGVVRGLNPPIRDQGIDIIPAGAEPQITFAMEIDRGPSASKN